MFSSTKKIHQQVQASTKAHSHTKSTKEQEVFVYSVVQRVLHKYSNKNNKGSVSTHIIVFAKVKDRNLKNSMYRIKFTNPKQQTEEKWVCVSKITMGAIIHLRVEFINLQIH